MGLLLTTRTRGSELEFQLLGQLGVKGEHGVIPLGAPKQRSVLAILLLHANEIVPTDRIIDLVWGDSPPRTADHSVQIYVSELRKALANGAGSDVIETRPPGYVINVPPDAVDSLRFERLVRDGVSAVRSGDASKGRQKLEAAVAAWTGEPLSDFAYDDFAQGYIRSLGELRSDALETLADLELAQGNIEAAREAARRAIEADPLREAPRRVMMLTLYRSGRQAEALRHFAGYREALADDLGIEPSEAMRELEERMLLQDPTLHLSADTVEEGNPYRGLRAFSEDDADVYFGRETLVREVLERLENGPGFVSIVGPSGSGKSSAARAGVTPALREAGETVLVLQPGARPLWELAGALDRAGYGSRATLIRRFESDPESLKEIVKRRVVLILDQFEELFTLAEPDVAIRFAELIAAAVRDHQTPLRVVATLRADYYDRPLSMPALAEVFSDSVVSVRPMTPHEIESAVVGPAKVAGITVESSLLAQLVADMRDKPGALPLLQFTLFEMYERTGGALTLADYAALGGIHDALTGGADELLVELDDEGRALAEQLMMRMIQKGRTMNTARPVALRDLVDLGLDSVDLQRVLEAFGSRRLITFDRDSSGAATVEIAHEYLISEWPQMETWLTEHSDDLDRLRALQLSAGEWVDADRSHDYVLRGERLERFHRWREETSLRLTRTENDFLDASVELKLREEEQARERTSQEETLQRTARRRLWAFGGAVAALAAAVTILVITLIPDPPPDVVVWSATSGSGFGLMINEGVVEATEALDLTFASYSDEALGAVVDVRRHLEQGSRLILIPQSLLGIPEVEALITDFPDTQFVWIDCQYPVGIGTADPAVALGLAPNEACIFSRHDEMGYLAGAAAAAQSETGHVGVLIGTGADFMEPFQTGFEQGVAFVDEETEVSALYLSLLFDGFYQPDARHARRRGPDRRRGGCPVPCRRRLRRGDVRRHPAGKRIIGDPDLGYRRRRR